MNSLIYGGLLLLIFIIILIYLTGSKEISIAYRTVFVLGTIVNLKAFGKNGEKAIDEAVDRLNQLDDMFSAFKPDSDIGRMNINSGGIPQKVNIETLQLLKKSKEYSFLCEGAFDPTIRPLVQLWGIGKNKEFIPEDSEIKEKMKMVNYEDIEINEDKCSVKLKRKNQAVDLGGIAKGYAADEIRDIFAKNKIKSGLIDLGGNIFVLGKKIDKSLWKVGVQDPFKDRGQCVGILSAEDKSVVTSGYYEKFFEKDGERYHHIINPITGYPSESEIISATIVSDHSIDGDGLSTGIYILGIEKGFNIIGRVKGIDAVLITENKKIYITPGIKDKFILTNGDYKVIIKEN
ncbi:MAG: FAD:protein FMN transferase [Bacillota bacterium]|nr:FAD:protein FMN transferase [Bacillota bacterium]